MAIQKSILLHIGTEKTGTTTIQNCLARNREFLAEQGILVPTRLGDTNHRLLASIANDNSFVDEFIRQMQLNDVESRAEAKIQWWNAFLDEVSQSNATRVIVSSEHLQSRLRTDHEVARLKARLDEAFRSIRICLYIREPLETAVSMYSTAVKSGSMALGIPEPGNEYFENVVNHARTIERWSRVFGAQNIIVRIYDKSAFKDGDLLSDFCEACNLPPMPSEGSDRSNESLSNFGIQVLRQVNARVPFFNPDQSVNTVRNGLVEFFEKYFTIGPRYQPDAALVRQYRETFAASNEKIRSQYFPDRPSLFREPELTSPAAAATDATSTAATAAAISELWTELARKRAARSDQG